MKSERRIAFLPQILCICWGWKPRNCGRFPQKGTVILWQPPFGWKRSSDIIQNQLTIGIHLDVILLCSTMVLNSKIQSYGGLPALLFLSRMSARAMVGRKLSQSMIFSRSRQSPSSLIFSNLFSSANREIGKFVSCWNHPSLFCLYYIIFCRLLQ